MKQRRIGPADLRLRQSRVQTMVERWSGFDLFTQGSKQGGRKPGDLHRLTAPATARQVHRQRIMLRRGGAFPAFVPQQFPDLITRHSPPLCDAPSPPPDGSGAEAMPALTAAPAIDGPLRLLWSSRARRRSLQSQARELPA